jgi:hypothetical protein
LCTPTSILPSLESLYQKCHQVYPPRSPTANDLTTVLVSTLQSYRSETYFIIDALDEVPRDDRDSVIRFLEKMTSLKLNNFHLLVTSRNEPDLQQSFTYPVPWSEEMMEETAVNRDIGLYVSRILEHSPLLRHQDEVVKRLIRKRLVNEGRGM